MMNYNELLEIYRNPDNAGSNGSPHYSAVKKILSPPPLENLEELSKISSSRFRYTGPGKWIKIIKEAK